MVSAMAATQPICSFHVERAEAACAGNTVSISSKASFSKAFSSVALQSSHVCQKRNRTHISSTAAPLCVAEATVSPPTVSDTKSAFLNKYKRPIPALYNNVIQELLVQQHLTRYNSGYKYDPIFALGFVSVYDQLMDGYPSQDDVETIFTAYIEALNEDPASYRESAKQLEEWAGQINGDGLVDFASKDGPVETLLKDIAARAGNSTGGEFHYSRLFAIGLFRLMELSQASEPATLEKLCTALKVNKMSVDRDLDVYRGLLSKLSQAKELLRDFLAREQKKQAEREKEKEKAQAKTE